MCKETQIYFSGTSSCRSDLRNDTASFVLDRQVMVDTGWSCVENLRNAGMDPATIPYLIVTHWHQDHYVSLPSLLFWHLCIYGTMEHLTIIALEEDTDFILERAMEFLQVKRFYPDARAPHLQKVRPGDRFESDTFSLATTASLHAVNGLCWRYVNKQTGVQIGFTGDTAYQSSLGEFFRGCDALLHECSLGDKTISPEQNARYLHSSAQDAGRVAKEAQVGQLILLHGSTATREECILAAKAVYDGFVTWPERGNTYFFFDK